jgi:o-succinylbenzoate synthase
VLKLAAARASLVRLQFVRPVRTARGEFAGRTSVLLELRDQDGVAGYGEAAPWPGFGTESPDEALAKLRDAQAMLSGVEAAPGQWPAELDAHLRGAPAARAAVQGALWDLAARRAGRPLADQLTACVGPLCGATLRRVHTSALLVARDPDALRDEAAGARAAGHLAVKLKLGGASLAEDVARARAARAGAGVEIALRGDANGTWGSREALAALDALEQFRFDYVEQPLPADDVEGLAELHRRSPVRLAADESVATAPGATRLIAAGAVDVVILKPATLGGPARALAIAAEARRCGIQVVFSHTFESAVGARHVLHCAAAWGDPAAVHGLATAGLFTSDVAEPVGCSDGWAEVSAVPGLGVSP